MASKFETFAALHVPGDPVILYNIWDAGSALAVVKAGAKALATGSHPVADANGWPDGQQVPMEFAFANARRIMDSVDLPLTVDTGVAGHQRAKKRAMSHARSLQPWYPRRSTKDGTEAGGRATAQRIE